MERTEGPKPAEGEPAASDQDDLGLGVAQIVITAATPMEEVEHPFPGVEETPEDPAKSAESSEGDHEASSAASSDPNESECKEEATVILDEKDGEGEEKLTIDELPTDSAPFPVSSSSGSEADSTVSGPSTNENSQSRGTVVEVTEGVMEEGEEEEMEDIPAGGKMLVGGRASIPDELQPDQLEKLQSLKESNA